MDRDELLERWDTLSPAAQTFGRSHDGARQRSKQEDAMTSTETDPYAAALADRPYLDDINAAGLRVVAQQWRVARAELGDLAIGTRVVEADPDAPGVVDPASVEADEIGVIAEPTEVELAEGAADSCTFESGAYVLVEWQRTCGDAIREWWVADDVQALGEPDVVAIIPFVR